MNFPNRGLYQDELFEKLLQICLQSKKDALGNKTATLP